MTLQQQIRRNRLRSGIVVVGFVVLLGVVAGLIGVVLDLRLGVVALVGASLYALFAIISSRRMVARMTGAQEVGPDQLRPLRRLVENVSIAAGLPVTPDVRIVDDPSPNAFAAGIRPQDELRRSHDGTAARHAEARTRGRSRPRDLARKEP